MRRVIGRTASPAALLLGLTLLGGCAGMGWEDILSGAGMGGGVRGEIDWVDERNREIALSSGWGGRETVRYDSRTRVIYRNQRYDVRDLERGDLVSIDVEGDNRGRRYASTVRVERSVRDSDRRGGGEYRVQRFDGRVTRVDTGRRQFAVEMGNREYQVNLSNRVSDSTYDRFRRLRRGARVRFEGERNNSGRIALIRFL